MKNQHINLLKQIGLRIIIIATVALIGEVIAFAVSLPFRDMIFITKSQDYFWFDGRRISCLAGVPFLAYCAIMSICAIFSKSHRAPKRLDIFGGIFAMGSVAMLMLFSIIAVVIHLYIIWLTPFRPCNEPELSYWYVIDAKVCTTIKAHIFY